MLLEMLRNQIQPQVFKIVQECFSSDSTMTTTPSRRLDTGGVGAKKKPLQIFTRYSQHLVTSLTCECVPLLKRLLSFRLCSCTLFSTFLCRAAKGVFCRPDRTERWSTWICVKSPIPYLKWRVRIPPARFLDIPERLFSLKRFQRNSGIDGSFKERRNRYGVWGADTGRIYYFSFFFLFVLTPLENG